MRIAAVLRRPFAFALPPRIARVGLLAGWPPLGLTVLGTTAISTLPVLALVVASPAYAAVRVLVPAEPKAPVGIVTLPSTSAPEPSTTPPDFSSTSPVGAAPGADTVTVTLLPWPTVTCAGRRSPSSSSRAAGPG